MNLTASIESAEFRFRQILEDFFVSVYDEQDLPSHGLNHHIRVWRYAREILSFQLSEHSPLAGCDPEKLIIACYLHDSGMSADPGPRHGKKSRELCQKFLVSSNLDPDDYYDLMETIENHDNKNYASGSHENSLLAILSLADDLDAFGYTGIYRYCEIYLRRGIAPSELGDLVRRNAFTRFDNLSRAPGAVNDYVSMHKKRYEVLDNFFLNYNIQAGSYNFETGIPAGYCGVVQLFIRMNRKNLSLIDFFSDANRYRNDSIIAWYIEGLQTELSAWRSHE